MTPAELRDLYGDESLVLRMREIAVVRWRDIPRLLLLHRKVYLGRTWAGIRPYIVWKHR